MPSLEVRPFSSADNHHFSCTASSQLSAPIQEIGSYSMEPGKRAGAEDEVDG